MSLARSWLALASLPLFSLPCAAAGNVLVVGGPSPTYATIQSAVDAATDGDLVLVKAGTYTGSVVVSAKALSIAADPPLSVTLAGGFRAELLPAGTILSLAGLHIDVNSGQTFQLIDCAGSIRATDVEVRRITLSDPVHVGNLARCADVALTRCSFTTSFDEFQYLTSALLVDTCNLAAFDCTLQAANGADEYAIGFPTQYPGPYDGGQGFWLRASFGTASAVLSGCTSVGGTGGDGWDGFCTQFGTPHAGGSGASGGNGALVLASSTLYDLNCSFTGGAGGAGGAPEPSCGAAGGAAGPAGVPVAAAGGAQTTWTSFPRSLVHPTLVREATPFQLHLAGASGDVAYIKLATDAGWQLTPAMQGVALLGTSPRRIALGTIGASGTLVSTVQFADLGAGTLFRTYQVQAVFRDAGGQAFLASASPLVVLDSSL